MTGLQTSRFYTTPLSRSPHRLMTLDSSHYPYSRRPDALNEYRYRILPLLGERAKPPAVCLVFSSAPSVISVISGDPAAVLALTLCDYAEHEHQHALEHSLPLPLFSLHSSLFSLLSLSSRARARARARPPAFPSTRRFRFVSFRYGSNRPT
jgi:hypothetical protein